LPFISRALVIETLPSWGAYMKNKPLLSYVDTNIAGEPAMANARPLQLTVSSAQRTVFLRDCPKTR